MNSTTTVALIGLCICHFFGDFTPLLTMRMIEAKKFGNPLLPILYHACVHGFLMFLFLIWVYEPSTAILLALFQISIHFVIDVSKGRVNKAYPECQNPATRAHWALFGIDQMLHMITIIVMCAIGSQS